VSHFTRAEFVTGLTVLGTALLSGAASAAVEAPTPRIDVHYHQFPQSYLSALRAHDQFAPKPMTTALALEDMDRAGITMAMLSIPSPVWFGDDVEARHVARQCNEEAAALVAAYPKRFGFFATLPLPDNEGSLREIEYALDTLKADGVAMVTSYGPKWLGDPTFAPVFDELNRRKALVYTHPITPDCCGNTLPGVNPTMIEFGTDTTRAMVSLLFNGVASRCSDMRVVFSHAGGTMTSLVDRFTYEARNPKVAKNLPNGVLYELQKFYYDTAQATSAAPMSALKKVVPVSQILLGTDFPFRDSLEQVNGLIQNGQFSERDIRAIQFDNVVRLIPRLR
jgi:predicted TIM-barrel fold metal-dependent hydrolase